MAYDIRKSLERYEAKRRWPFRNSVKSIARCTVVSAKRFLLLLYAMDNRQSRRCHLDPLPAVTLLESWENVEVWQVWQTSSGSLTASFNEHGEHFKWHEHSLSVQNLTPTSINNADDRCIVQQAADSWKNNKAHGTVYWTPDITLYYY